MTQTAQLSIQVITHNGQLPSEGGKRMGYRGRNYDGTWGGISWILPPVAVTPPPTLPSSVAPRNYATATSLIWDNLPREIEVGKCNQCCGENLDERRQTNHGEHDVAVCRLCGFVMRFR